MGVDAALPSEEEFENLFVNNQSLEMIEAYLNRFNPITVMRMERQEIRHSAILAWLLDPLESHGLADQFLKAFLGEALKGNRSEAGPSALDISQADLRDSEVRREWQSIDIFILCLEYGWAFIIENKFDSRQHHGQLAKYRAKVDTAFKQSKSKISTVGIFLTLQEEEPEDKSFISVRYGTLCEILERFLTPGAHNLASEITVFLNHYLEVLKDAAGMSEDQNKMEKLARELYRNHRKVLDFVMAHGAGSDFAIAARNVIKENTDQMEEFEVMGKRFVFTSLNNRQLGFLPKSWFDQLSSIKPIWEGCETYWARLPLICCIEIMESGVSKRNSLTGALKFTAEVGPLSDHDLRKRIIEGIEAIGASNTSFNISFQNRASEQGRRFSRFFKRNTLALDDIQNPDEMSSSIETLISKFSDEIDAIAEALPELIRGEGAEI